MFICSILDLLYHTKIGKFGIFRKNKYLCSLNRKVYFQALSLVLMCRLCPPIAKSPITSRHAVPKGTARRSAECPDGGIGRRAGLKHQWSNPCRFDPGSGYQTKCKCLIFKHLHFSFSFLHHACTTEWAVLGQNLCFSKNFSIVP